MLHDKDIREPLFFYLEDKFGKVRIFEEKNMGDSRADVVMVGADYIMGIEIKSDADSYARLDRQVKDYDLYFDYNYVVVGSTHAAGVKSHVPEHWGIISVELIDDKLDIYNVRNASLNPNCDIHKKIRFLWRPELAHIQELCGLYAYKTKSKDYVRDYLIESVDAAKLNMLISEELFERDYTTIGQDIKAYRQAQNPRKRVKKKRVSHRRRV
jgi:hypothetical protein